MPHQTACPRITRAPRPALLLALPALLLGACPEPVTRAGPPGPPAPLPELDPVGAVLPPQYLAAAFGGPPRPAPSLAQARAALTGTASHAPLARALRQAGLDDEQAARLLWAAAAHNSGEEHDPVRARARRLNAAFRRALQRFDAALAAEERRRGRAIDRAELNRRLGMPLARQEALR